MRYSRYFLLVLLLAASTTIFAQPKITSVSPIAGPLGMTITINGSNFDPVAANDAVYLGPVKATIISASTSVLKVKVPTGTAYAPIIVTADGLTSFPIAPFVLTWPGGGTIDSGSFILAGGNHLATGSLQTSTSMAIGDLDGDGYPDVIANYSSTFVPTYGAGGFSVFQNQGVPDTLSLASAYTYSYGAGNAPRCIAIQDLDGDGKPDIAVDSSNGQTILLLLNTSSGGLISFAPQGTLADSLLPGGVSQILLMDFNGDGKPDIIVLNQDSLLVLANTSTAGHLSFITMMHRPTGGNAVVADFDGDGKPDLAILGNGVITIYSYTNPAFTIPTGGSALAAGDLNGDGKPDLVTSNFSFPNGIVSVYHNVTTTIGHPNFTRTDNSVVATDGPIAIGDLDGDGKPDVAFLGGSSDNVCVMKNNSTTDSIILHAPLLYTGGAEPVQLYIGDLYGTGRNNIASLGEAGGNLEILKYVLPPPPPPPPPPFHLVSFTGTLLDGQVLLQWQVTGSAGISSYIVQQATDTLHFQPIGTIEASGADSAHYSFTDTATREDTSYYRLEMIDTAGNITYSNSISVVLPVIPPIPPVPTIFNVYPNPARNLLTLTLPANSSSSVVRIVDIFGTPVLQMAVAAGATQVNFDLTQLAAGVYLLKWSSAAGTRSKLILVVK